MGVESSYLLKNESNVNRDSMRNRPNQIPTKCPVLDIQVSFYTPSSFPLLPVVSARSLKLCQDSWHIIIADTVNELGSSVSGFTVFYNDFYDRLNVIDTTKAFDKVLSKYCYGHNKIATKGSIIIRIVKYILSLDFESKSTITKLGHLGKAHSTYGIRPWMYSLFVETLLLTIASRLGYHARAEVMEAWVNIFAFTFKHMLPTAIKGLVNEDELHVRVCPHAEDISLLQANTAAVSKPQRFHLPNRTSSISPIEEVEHKDAKQQVLFHQPLVHDDDKVQVSITNENLDPVPSPAIRKVNPDSQSVKLESKQLESSLIQENIQLYSKMNKDNKDSSTQEYENEKVGNSTIPKYDDRFNFLGRQRKTGSCSSIVGAENSPRGQGGRDYIASSEYDSDDGSNLLLVESEYASNNPAHSCAHDISSTSNDGSKAYKLHHLYPCLSDERKNKQDLKNVYITVEKNYDTESKNTFAIQA